MNSKDFDTVVINAIDKAAEDLNDQRQSEKTSSSAGEAMDSASHLSRSNTETVGNKKYTYSTEAPSLSSGSAEHLNPDTGLLENLPEEGKGSSGLMLPWTKQKMARYVAKAPVDKNVGEKPAFDELVGTDKSAKICWKSQGTIDDPNEINSMIVNNLYIDNTVHEEDVRQGNIGDCYFLSSLLQVIRHDPSVILNMMSISGSTVTTNFYRREETTEKDANGQNKKVTRWVQQPVDVQFGILKQNGSIKSSRYRIAYDPKLDRWSSSTDNRTLKINREHMYEAAMWVACIEQAYMIFAQKYGQYGEGDPQGLNLVDSIDGGHAQKCMYLFFGDKVTSACAYGVNNAQDGVDLIQNNKWIISELLNYTQTVDGTGDTVKYLMAGSDMASATTRLAYYAGVVANELSAVAGNNQNLKKALKNVQDVQQAASLYNSASDAQKASYKATIDAASLELKKNSSFQDLHLATYNTMQEAMGIVVAKVTGNPNKYNNIFIYSSHAYSVHTVNLVNSEGADLSKKSLDEVLAEVDPTKSSVTMQNPHAMTKPAMNEAEDRYNDGKFTVSLNSFLSNIAYLRQATVSNK